MRKTTYERVRTPGRIARAAALVGIGRTRRELLADAGWYRNLNGGWTHPHCLDHMSASEILGCSPDELAYKLRHGSRAVMPGGH